MSYGRNFGFLVTPKGGQRAGRYALDGTSIPIGAPVVITGDSDALGLLEVTLATGAQAKPAPGKGGIAVYEHAPQAFNGVDPVITTYSDIDRVPAGGAVQVISGSEIKVVLKNTTDTTFLSRANYPAARTMVAGVGATPTVAVGDFLTPGTGNDNAGYWAETSNAAEAWLVVTKVDAARGEVEARLNF